MLEFFVLLRRNKLPVNAVFDGQEDNLYVSVVIFCNQSSFFVGILSSLALLCTIYFLLICHVTDCKDRSRNE